MTVTSDDVARAAGVSRPAVSQILNGRGRFAPETIRRVEEMAAAMNYRPSAAARTLATGTSDLVVALVPNTTFGTNLQDVIDVLTAEQVVALGEISAAIRAGLARECAEAAAADA